MSPTQTKNERMLRRIRGRLGAQLDRCCMVHQCRLSVGGQKPAKTGLVLPGVCGRAKPLICMRADLMDRNGRLWRPTAVKIHLDSYTT